MVVVANTSEATTTISHQEKRDGGDDGVDQVLEALVGGDGGGGDGKWSSSSW